MVVVLVVVVGSSLCVVACWVLIVGCLVVCCLLVVCGCCFSVVIVFLVFLWAIGRVELPLAKRCTSPTSKNLNEASRPMFYGFLENMCFDAHSLVFDAQCLARRVPRCEWWRWCLVATVVAIMVWLSS